MPFLLFLWINFCLVIIPRVWKTQDTSHEKNPKDPHLFHPESEGALPGVFLLQVQVCVEEDEVNVALQVLQAPQQQLLTLALRFTAFDLKKKKEELGSVISISDGTHKETSVANSIKR